jgi:hypothetical protein
MLPIEASAIFTSSMNFPLNTLDFGLTQQSKEKDQTSK